MQTYNDYEKEIDLKDLLFHVLYRWRSCVVAALIGAVLLGCFQFARLEMTHREGKLTEEEIQYQIDYDNYYTTLNQYRRDLETYQTARETAVTYRDNSLIFEIDPQNAWLAQSSFYVQLDQAILDKYIESQTDPTDFVLPVYASALTQNLEDPALAKLFGTDKAPYIQEVASVATNADQNIVTATAWGATQEEATQRMNLLVGYIKALEKGEAQEIYKNTLQPVSETISSRINNGFADTKLNNSNTIADYEKRIKDTTQLLSDLELEEEPEAPGNHIKKFAAIGFILGAFLLAGVYMVKYVLENRLHGASDLSGPYAIPVLGEFAQSRARTCKGIDKWLAGLELKYAQKDPETVLGNVCALLNETAAGKKVLLTGTVGEAELQQLCKAMEAKLNTDVQLSMCADFINTASAVTQACGADAVVLVEKKYRSVLSDVEKMVNALQIGKAKVAGAIIL